MLVRESMLLRRIAMLLRESMLLRRIAMLLWLFGILWPVDLYMNIT